MITCITPTGDRHKAFDLCRRWIWHQTVKPDQWIVVDDGIDPIPDNSIQGFQYIRRIRQAVEPQHTLVLNLAEAVPHIKGDYIFIIEDDDYYHANYIETMVSHLINGKIAVGITRAKYYHLSGKYLININERHASLAQTGFCKSMLPDFVRLLPGNPFFDLRIWKQFNIYGNFSLFDDQQIPLHVGMKGLPGRRGIGAGHRENSKYISDTHRIMLKKWVPNHYDVYINMYEEHKK